MKPNVLEMELQIMLGKVEAMMRRETGPSRDGAVAAIDYYLRRCKVLMDERECVNLDELHCQDAGLPPRIASIIEDTYGVWSVGGLRSLTEQDLCDANGIDAAGVKEVKAILCEYGLYPSTQSAPDELPVEPFGDEEARLDQLLERWLLQSASAGSLSPSRDQTPTPATDRLHPSVES